MIKTIALEMHENEKLAGLQPIFEDQKPKQNPFNIIIGKSKRMVEVDSAIRLASSARSPVLLRGEIGTDKEGFASVIHFQSPRADCPFVKFSFAAASPLDLESELFGYERVMTGKTIFQNGLFESANHGTFFLNDIEKIPLGMQAKFVGILQEKKFQKPGSRRTVCVDIRFVAATHVDLAEEVRAGRFREDLYYRLNVIPIFLPPLRERREDLTCLIRAFLDRFNLENSKNIKGIANTALRYLMCYSWPGNLPELENVLERACVLCRKEVLTLDLFPALREETPEGLNTSAPKAEPSSRMTLQNYKLPQTVKEIERQMIEEAWQQTGGVQKKAAQLLGITERMLGYKIKIYGLRASLPGKE